MRDFLLGRDPTNAAEPSSTSGCGEEEDEEDDEEEAEEAHGFVLKRISGERSGGSVGARRASASLPMVTRDYRRLSRCGCSGALLASVVAPPRATTVHSCSAVQAVAKREKTRSLRSVLCVATRWLCLATARRHAWVVWRRCKTGRRAHQHNGKRAGRKPAWRHLALGQCSRVILVVAQDTYDISTIQAARRGTADFLHSYAISNPEWLPDDGGMLRLHRPDDGSYVDVEPLLDQAVVFWSDARTPHEVLPANKPRWAVSAWYHHEEAKPERTCGGDGEAAGSAGGGVSEANFGNSTEEIESFILRCSR